MAKTRAPVTKELFLTAVACPTQAWYLANSDAAPPTVGERFRMEEGQEVHEFARTDCPEGQFAGTPDKTARLLASATATVLFEAAFEVDGFSARADILRKRKRGIVVTEVKSSLHDDEKVHDEHIDDLAYTVMVLRRAGQNVLKATLLQLSREYRRNGRSPMFAESDHSEAVFERADEFDQQWQVVRDALARNGRPRPRLMFACRDCPYFESECLGSEINHPVFDLPALREKRFAELTEAGYLAIPEIPEDFELTENQHRVRRAVVTGKPEVDKAGLRRCLKGVAWPAFYLDFETMKTALPVWNDIAPHEQVLTQYSIHRCSAPGRVDEHREFLAEPTRDCRLELAESLLRELKGKGSIVVYSSFEKTMLASLATRFPRLAKPLNACIERLFDLERAFKQHFYHPAFRGRTSIKKTLPVLVPTMKYEGLAVADGDSAMTLSARMARGQLAEQEAVKLRAALLEYCGQDTLAMVELHAALQRYCD